MRDIVLYIVIAVVILVIASGIWAIPGTFVPDHVANDALTSAGFSQVDVTERATWLVGLRGCGNDDNVIFYATAVNPKGEKVDVYVCAGLLKGATIRFP